MICLLLAFSAGCSTRIGDFSVLSTGAPQYDSMAEAPIIQSVTGEDGRGWFLFIPLGAAPNMKEAVHQCLDKGNGDFMERARIYSTCWTFFGLFSYEGYKVVGGVGNSKVDQLKQKKVNER